ncbi:sensor histidine kinase [Oerskovia jenensis]|uniref:histidine kinase n=1 Tax=Oerskovia jenensis TaxID=162169 RepID=A0ABS2LIN0_9CELL|nr:histidine kinase [Oerskovia jenensis]MBM7480270.1 signal transduction histidine kinase [Oerskovia jenensis]
MRPEGSDAPGGAGGTTGPTLTPRLPLKPRPGSAAVFTELDARRLGPIRRYFVRHPVVMDWFVAAWFAVPGLLVALLYPEPRYGVAVATLAGGAALLWRRRYPLWTAAAIGALAILTLALTGDSAGFELATAFAVYAVATTYRPAVAWSVLGVLILTVCTAEMLWYDFTVSETGAMVRADVGSGELTGQRIATIAFTVTFALLGIAIGSSVRGRRLHVADLVGRANAIARDRDQQAQLAAAAERARISREMHDVVAHSLTVMVALADGAKALGAKDPVLAGQALDELTETGRAALADMRRVLGVLRDPDGTVAPLTPTADVPSMEDIAERFRHAGLPVRLVRVGVQPDPDPGLRQAAHRIVQESLTNVLRYAPLTPVVVVEIARRDAGTPDGGDWLEITVTNKAGRAPGGTARDGADVRPLPPGITGDQPIGTGRGIIGMRERAAVYGGTVTAGPTSSGWEVVARLRLDGATQHRPDGGAGEAL